MISRKMIHLELDLIEHIFHNSDRGINVAFDEYEIVEEVYTRMVPDGQVMHVVYKCLDDKFYQRMKR